MYKKTRPGKPEPNILPFTVEFPFVNLYKDEALLRDMANWCVGNVGGLMRHWRISEESFESRAGYGYRQERTFPYQAKKKLFHFESDHDALSFKLAWYEHLTRTGPVE